MATSQQHTLTTLPNELLLIIASHLDIDDRLLLRSMNRHFNTLIPPPTAEDYLLLEVLLWIDAGRREHYLYCNCCKKFLRREAFEKSTYPPAIPAAKYRFCLKCGLDPRPTPGCTGSVEPRSFRGGLPFETDVGFGERCRHRYGRRV